MAKQIYSNFDAGLATQDRNLPANQFAVGRNIDTHRDYGYLKPGYTGTDLTGAALDGLPLDFAVDPSTGKAYTITHSSGTVTRVHQIDIASGVRTDGGVWSFLISGANITGLPTYYDLEGTRAYLYPSPAAANVTTTSGLKWYVIRDIVPFEVTDTSTEPGFDNHFHRIVSLGASYDFCLGSSIDDRKDGIKKEIDQLHSEINEHYGFRNRASLPRMIPTDTDSI